MQINNLYRDVCVNMSAFIQARNQTIVSAALYMIGIGILILAGTHEASAGLGNGRIEYNDQRLVEATNAVLTYLEGSFGALVMVASGIGCIISAAFGQYRSAIGLLVVAIGSFILRSLVGTFFNDTGLQG